MSSLALQKKVGAHDPWHALQRSEGLVDQWYMDDGGIRCHPDFDVDTVGVERNPTETEVICNVDDLGAIDVAEHGHGLHSYRRQHYFGVPVGQGQCG